MTGVNLLVIILGLSLAVLVVAVAMLIFRL